MIRAAALYRQSTDMQDESTGDQKKAAMKRASADGAVIVKEFMPEKGYASGLSIENDPVFKEMIAYLERPDSKIERLYIYDVSRLGRMGARSKFYWEERISRAGVKIVYVAETFSGDGSFGDEIFQFLAHSKAHEYSMRLRVDTIRGCKTHAALGRSCGGAPPYGYDRLLIDAEGKQLQVLKGGQRKAQKTEHIKWTPGDPEKIEIVRWLFRSRDAGNGTTGMADELNRRGVPAPRGKFWGKTSVRAILLNPVYVGTRIYFHHDYHDRSQGSKVRHRRRKQEEWIIKEGAHEPLIDKDLFKRVQATFRKNKARDGRHHDSPHLLSGLIYCTHCTHRYCGQYHHHEGERTRYYDCGGYNSKGKVVCESFSIKADILEEFALDHAKRRLREIPSRVKIETKLNGIVAAIRGGGTDARLKELAGGVASVDVEINNLMAVLALRPASAALIETLDKLEKKKTRLQEELEALKAQVPGESFDVKAAVDEMMEFSKDLKRLLVQSSAAEKKSVLRTFIKRVDIDRKKREARFLFLKLPGMTKKLAGPEGAGHGSNRDGCGGWI